MGDDSRTHAVRFCCLAPWRELLSPSLHLSCVAWGLFNLLELAQELLILGFLLAQAVKNPPAMWETWLHSLVWEDSSGGGHGNPLQDSCLGNPQEEEEGQRSLAGYSPWGYRESDMTEWLSIHIDSVSETSRISAIDLFSYPMFQFFFLHRREKRYLWIWAWLRRKGTHLFHSELNHTELISSHTQTKTLKK